MARKFLYLVAIVIVLLLAGALVYRLFPAAIMRTTMVPSSAFTPQAAVADNAYADRAMWVAHPAATDGNPALWLPEGVSADARGTAAVFFIHPTSYLEKKHWNAPIDDKDANEGAALFLRGQASAFNAAGEIWAPRYRQATFGAFLTSKADAQKALDLAYGDVKAAFTQFLREIDGDRPIILAGHSQGALHLTRLLKDEVAGSPLARRIVAAYAVGWPISLEHDLAALGLAACTAADQTGCVLSWQSFAEPADPAMVTKVYAASIGFDGRARGETRMLCTNPLTGGAADAATVEINLGTLVPSSDMKTAKLVKNAVPARCDARGFLLIGDAPDLGPFVLPGNNYHVYDYGLFWANIRADALRRLAAFGVAGGEGAAR